MERTSRIKFDNNLDHWLERLIDEQALDLPESFDFVSVNSFVGNAFISKNGRIRFESAPQKKLSCNLTEGFSWFESRNWIGKSVTAFNCSQELAHIGSCLPFFGEFNENSLLVHFDGGASCGNFSAFHYKDGTIHLIENHWELVYLSKFFNNNSFIFRVLNAQPGEHCSVPGKLMGYACWGNYSEDIEIWLRNNDYFNEYWHKENEILDSAWTELGIKISGFDNKESFWQSVAATLQHIFEREFIQKVRALQSQTGAKYLYYSGGCALNIVANTKLIKENIFNDVFIPPCCNDSGLSIGGAALLERIKGNRISIHSPYLNNIGLKNQTLPIVTIELIREAAGILMNNGIIGVCNGEAEVGPRALGNRSLIALPNNRSLAEYLSRCVKAREWYRPIAPIMLSEIAQMVTQEGIHPLAKYMLMDFTIKSQYENDLAGVIHANGTARIQVLTEENENVFMFRLLTFLYKEYGILGLINTSFNLQEPIVHTPEDALSSAEKMKLNALILNHILIKRT